MAHWLYLRPTFEIPIDLTRQQAIERLGSESVRQAQPKIFFTHGEYGELHLPTNQHRLWSPHLSFYICEEQDQTFVRGRFAPRLEIWTFVWILYLAMSFIGLFALVMEFSKWSIGEESWWRWGALLSAIIIAAIYMVANVGQQCSSDQMKTLREQLETILTDTGLIN